MDVGEMVEAAGSIGDRSTGLRRPEAAHPSLSSKLVATPPTQVYANARNQPRKAEPMADGDPESVSTVDLWLVDLSQ